MTEAAVHLPVAGRARAGDGGTWGLVLGGGGVLGAAWLVGALEGLQVTRGLDARRADVILGTSAGSVVGALLAAGVSVAEQRAQQLGEEAGTGPEDEAPGRTGRTSAQAGTSTQVGASAGTDASPGELAARLAAVAFDPEHPAGPDHPPRPRWRPGSPALLRNNRGALRSLPRTTLLAALAPAGRGRMAGVAALMEALAPGEGWPSHPGYRAVALDYEAGRRVVFGAPGAPAAGLAAAVLASCAIPGWFEPVMIGGHRYVDGGMWSTTNADLLADAGLDEIFVLAPMASAAYDAPNDWRARVERRLRAASTRRCLAEAREVQRRGTAVTVLGPGPEDLTLMGYNLMAPARRGPVLRSAVRTATVAFGAPVESQDRPGVSLDEPLIPLDPDTDPDRSEPE
jgi:NTE family protein